MVHRTCDTAPNPQSAADAAGAEMPAPVATAMHTGVPATPALRLRVSTHVNSWCGRDVVVCVLLHIPPCFLYYFMYNLFLIECFVNFRRRKGGFGGP